MTDKQYLVEVLASHYDDKGQLIKEGENLQKKVTDDFEAMSNLEF